MAAVLRTYGSGSYEKNNACEQRGETAQRADGETYTQATAQRLAEILNNLVNADASHGSDGKGTDERVGILRVLFVNIELANEITESHTLRDFDNIGVR